MIPIGQKQLDPDAIWISAIFTFTFPPGVLATYVAHFLLLRKTLPIESHVQGLDNVTNISTLVALAPNLQEEVLSGFLPSWLNLIFSHDFGWHSFTTELLDYLQLESRSTFAGADMGALKAMHQKKEWWWPRLCMCIEGCTDKTVLKFAKKAWTNLLNNRLTTSIQVKDSTLERVSHFSRECHVTILHDSYLGSQLRTHSCWQN